MKKVQKGKALEELVKGSIDYTMAMIRKAFRDQFPEYGAYGYLYIEEVFGDHVIVKPDRGLKVDEFYLVTYQRSGESIVFAAQEQWQVVELAYQPQSAMSESRKAATQGRKRMVEEMGHLALAESVEEGAPRRVKAVGITANVINGNDRLYPAEVLEAAVQELQPKLVESAGSGRVLQVLGEAEHPSTKGGRPNILETVFKWEAVSFDGSQVLLEGIILPTSKGRDILALLENGVQVPISQRAYGASKTEKIEGRKVEKVTELHITGYDATLEPSDPVAVILESRESDEEKENMDPEEMKKYITDHPELFEGMVAGQVEKMSQAQLAKVEEQIRTKLGVDATVELGKALEEAAQAKRELEQQKRQRAIDEAIVEQSKGLPYGEKLNGMFVESLKKAGLESAEAVKKFAESKRAEYDQLAAAGVLNGMGFKSNAERVQVTGPVIEKETGTPEFARAAFELSESIRKAERRLPRDLRQPKTINEEITALYLAKFDKTFQRQLLQEAKLLEEAEQASDLSLPYSVSRAVIAEAFPELIAISVFDFAMSDQADTAKLFYEAHSGETGYLATVTDEVVTSDESAWKALGYKRITPGSVVLTGSGGTPTYVEGTDYVIDYANGQMWTLPSPGAIGDGTSLKIDYTYTAIRKGELAAIEKAKLTLSTKTLTLAADRLATDISNEAVVFSRGALGYDATGRTLASLVRQMRRKIDQGILYKALASELIVASNSGGTWTASTDPVSELVEKIGVSKVKLINRFYVPTSILISATNAEKLSNWDGFTQAGSRPDAMVTAYGFIGSLKGLPVFQSPEMSDRYVSVQNRELVMHRVGRPLQLFGPFPSYEVSTGKLIASNQYYCEEFNGSDSPVPEKGSYVKIA